MNTLLELVIIVLLILLNGVLACAEMAVVAVRITRVRELADDGHKGARAVLRLKKDPEQFLATIQTGITLVAVTAAAFGGETLTGALAALLLRSGLPMRYAEDVALAVVIGAISYLAIVV